MHMALQTVPKPTRVLGLSLVLDLGYGFLPQGLATSWGKLGKVVRRFETPKDLAS